MNNFSQINAEDIPHVLMQTILSHIFYRWSFVLENMLTISPKPHHLLLLSAQFHLR
jgi:hypothetical protein